MIEENLLQTLSAKQELSLAVLDPHATASKVDFSAGIEELKRRMEALLGARPSGPEDQRQKEQVEKEAEAIARRKKISAAGGHLLGSAFSFIGEMFSGHEQESGKVDELAGILKNRFSDCMEKDEDGGLKMTVSLPDETAIDNMARSLAMIMNSRK